jgi:hypothetical protein
VSPEGTEERLGQRRVSTPQRKASSVAASEVRAEPVEWLWPERIPLSAITVLAGDPGLGKSLLTIELAARLTRGDLTGVSESVLLLTAEDSLAHVVRPRLEAAGAELGRIRFGSIERDGFPTSVLLPGDQQALRRLVLDEQARLVVIDPLAAHLSAAINSWKDQEVRQALAPVHRLAEEADAGVVVVAHLNKGQSSDPLHRLGGSIGLPAAARSVLLLARDPDDPDGDEGSRRVLAQAKSNLGPLSPSLRFEITTVTIDSAITTAVIREAGVSAYAAAELLVSDRPRTGGRKLAQAIELLEHALRSGPLPVEQLRLRAAEHGISESTLERAKNTLAIESSKIDFDNGWQWNLPTAKIGTESRR